MFSKELLDGIDFKSFPVKPNDTIVLNVDTDKWDIDAVCEVFHILEKTFPPTNTIIVTFKGIDIDIK